MQAVQKDFLGFIGFGKLGILLKIPLPQTLSIYFNTRQIFREKANNPKALGWMDFQL